jgi:ubiquinol-cytochrome c reductase cytochrome c1 subunit
MRIESLVVAAVVFLAGAAMPAAASEGPKLDGFAPDVTDVASLQRGARNYVNFCLGCHGLSLMRYNALTQIGLTDDQIRDNLMFTAQKVGEPIVTAMTRAEGKAWFGAAPPDLSVIARSRGPSWLYTYLRGFYRDPTTQTGWNNTVFPNVGMPHAMWTLQGERGMTMQPVTRDGKPVMDHGKPLMEPRFETLRPGSQSALEYDRTVSDLVNFLVWVGEPVQERRRQLGYLVLIGLGVLMFVTWMLYKEFWKDVH